jgi:hypothetical protein
MSPTRPFLLAGVLATCAAAAHASAAPAPTLFKLSISGTAHAEWDHTGVAVPFQDCNRTIRSEGIRSVRFRAAKPTVVRVVNGRVLAATVRRVAGTVTLAGANTIRDVCGPETREAIQDCATTKRTFRTATIALVSTRAGSLTLRSVRNARLRTSACPREPAEVVRAPLGPVPGPLRVSTASLADKGVARITLTASKSGTVNYGPLEQGRLRHGSAWKLTLERVQE